MESKNKFSGSKKNLHGPHTFGEVLDEYFHSNDPLAVAYGKRAFNEQGWNHNTDLAVDLKTILRSDSRMKTGKDYRGVLRRDADEEIEDFRCRDPHYTFVETIPPATEKRNPQVFRGKFITVTRKDDGTYRPNFKPMKVDADFNLAQYASSVANELLWALEALVEDNVKM